MHARFSFGLLFVFPFLWHISHGDSGGPVFQYDEFGEPVLVGIITGSEGCGIKTYPIIAERTWPYYDFIPSESVIFTNNTEPVFSPDVNLPLPTDDGSGEETIQSDSNSDPTADPASDSVPVGLIIGATFGAVVLVALVFIIPTVAYLTVKNRKP